MAEHRGPDTAETAALPASYLCQCSFYLGDRWELATLQIMEMFTHLTCYKNIKILLFCWTYTNISYYIFVQLL